MIFKIRINEAFASFKETFSQYSNNAPLFSFCVTTVCELWENGYLSEALDINAIERLEYGKSICIFAPTGSGKSIGIKKIIENSSKDESIIILTNRKPCTIQLIQELFGEGVSEDTLEKVNSKIRVMTYQKFTKHKLRYQGKKLTLICDECHCFAEDSLFSCYPKKMVKFLRDNRENTRRIYMTATPDDVLAILWNIEAFEGQKFPVSTEDFENFRKQTSGERITRIEHIYMKKPDWEYLTFKFYDPDKREVLIDYINQICSNGQKALVFINDKEKGAAMQEKLPDCQHIYSDEDKAAEIREIAVNQSFQANALITTKVAENGLSLHDDKLSLVIAESVDPITIQQIIGRARNPKQLVVLIPDYKANHLGSIEGRLLMQFKEFQSVMNNPDFAMEKYCHIDNPYVYYDGILKRPVVNNIGYFQIKRQLEYVQRLKQEENETPHAYIHRVLNIYGKDTEITDDMYINYDRIKDCKSRISTAWETYETSSKNENALRSLKESLKTACNETGAYGKELTSNIQIETINKVLQFAGIQGKLSSGRMVYDTSYPEESKD